jgi:hypothetical protein
VSEEVLLSFRAERSDGKSSVLAVVGSEYTRNRLNRKDARGAERKRNKLNRKDAKYAKEKT